MLGKLCLPFSPYRQRPDITLHGRDPLRTVIPSQGRDGMSAQVRPGQRRSPSRVGPSLAPNNHQASRNPGLAGSTAIRQGHGSPGPGPRPCARQPTGRAVIMRITDTPDSGLSPAAVIAREAHTGLVSGYDASRTKSRRCFRHRKILTNFPLPVDKLSPSLSFRRWRGPLSLAIAARRAPREPRSARSP